MTDQQPYACVCGTPYTMTPQEWRETSRDYKGVHRDAAGKLTGRSALRYCPVHGTTLASVTIIK